MRFLPKINSMNFPKLTQDQLFPIFKSKHILRVLLCDYIYILNLILSFKACNFFTDALKILNKNCNFKLGEISLYPEERVAKLIDRLLAKFILQF